MIFYASRPVVGAGPPMAGPSTSPHTFGPVRRWKRDGGRRRRRAEGERDARHNLAIIPLFIPGAPAALGHLNLLNTRRLVHFIKPLVCTRAIHFPLPPFLSISFFFSFRERLLFFSHLEERKVVAEQGTPQDVESLTRSTGTVTNPIRDRGRETRILN